MLIHPYSSPIGAITLAADGKYLTGLWFDGQKNDRRGVGDDVGRGACEAFDQAIDWLDAYFAGDRPSVVPVLRLRGTPFQVSVWELLCEIPYGQTTTYGALARELEHKRGVRTSARAIGSAVGRNPISIIVPCHRVLGADGSLTGYAGGIERKRALLSLECKASEVPR